MARIPKTGDIVLFGVGEGKDGLQREVPKAKPAVVVEVSDPGNPKSPLSVVVFSNRGATYENTACYSETLECKCWSWPSE
jgi:hypothetical protein